MDYEIIKKLSKHEKSEVDLCRHKHTNSLYTVKKLSVEASFDARVRTEIEIASKLDHKNIQSLHEVLNHDSHTHLVFKYIDGLSLQKYVDIYGPVSAQKVTAWMIDLCSALDYIHTGFTYPLIHRDIKPDNLIIDPDGIIHLIDFGISRFYNQQVQKDTMALGSIGYAAPEQYGSGQTDARSDIYGLGASMYYALTGNSLSEPPYQVIPPHIVNKDISKKLSAIIVKCSQFNPEDRYADSTSLLDDIRSVCENCLQNLLSKTVVKVAVGTLFGAAITALLFLALTPRQQPLDTLTVVLPSPSPTQQEVQTDNNNINDETSTLSQDTEPDSLPEDSITDVSNLPPDTQIEFADAEMERLLRTKLNIPSEEIVTADHLSTIKVIFISGLISFEDENEYLEGVNGISSIKDANQECIVTSIEDLKYCANLSSLCINSGYISDISEISNLTKLETITFQSGQIKDLTPLENLPYLRNLNLSDNPIKDYTPIASLKSLESLTLDDMNYGIDNLDFISELSHVRHLLLRGANLDDIKPIENLKQLSYLRLSDNNLADLSPISGMHYLDHLYIENNMLTDISALKDLPRLKVLNLQSNLITDITPLLSFHSLTRLEVQGNLINDFSGLENLAKLEYIDVTGNPGAFSQPIDALIAQGVEVIR